MCSFSYCSTKSCSRLTLSLVIRFDGSRKTSCASQTFSKLSAGFTMSSPALLAVDFVAVGCGCCFCCRLWPEVAVCLALWSPLLVELSTPVVEVDETETAEVVVAVDADADDDVESSFPSSETDVVDEDADGDDVEPDDDADDDDEASESADASRRMLATVARGSTCGGSRGSATAASLPLASSVLSVSASLVVGVGVAVAFDELASLSSPAAAAVFVSCASTPLPATAAAVSSALASCGRGGGCGGSAPAATTRPSLLLLTSRVGAAVPAAGCERAGR